MMRAIPVLALIIGLAACQPSDLVRDQSDDSTPHEAAMPAFPAGVWSDGLGNAWDMTIEANALSGLAVEGEIRGVIMKGSLYGERLDYQISDSAGVFIARGSAHRINPSHAWFETEWADGTPAGHGLFHFGHDAMAAEIRKAHASDAPMDLRPCPDLVGG